MTRTHRGTVRLLAGLALLLSGCHGGNRRIAHNEPGLDPSVGGGTAIAGAADPTAPASSSPAWVDRHPLFSRPRDIYASTPSQNKLVKGAAATVVGVPVGLFGEMKQIVVGREPPSGGASLAEAPDEPFSPSVMMGEVPTTVTELPPSSAALAPLDPGSVR
jgi:hypothetical protein